MVAVNDDHHWRFRDFDHPRQWRRPSLTMRMELEEQLRRRLDAGRESIRAKYKAMASTRRPNDPIRGHLADEIEREFKRLRDSLSEDEIVQVQARIDAVQPDVGPMRLSVVAPTGPTLFTDLQDEYHFLERLLKW